MMQNRHIEYCYRGQRYVVDIEDCTVMPQCYAAIAENLAQFKGMHMIADIGNGTMNVMILNNGKAMESKSWTVKLGVNQCFMAIRNLILDKKTEELPAEIIENFLRYGDTGVPDIYYGDETGVQGGSDPDCRRTFPWGKEDVSLQDFYLNAVRLHKNIPALRGGSLVPVIMDEDLAVYGRFKGDDAALTVIYTGKESAHVSIDLSDVNGAAPTAAVRVLHSSSLAVSLGRKKVPIPMGRLELTLLPQSAEIYVW